MLETPLKTEKTKAVFRWEKTVRMQFQSDNQYYSFTLVLLHSPVPREMQTHSSEKRHAFTLMCETLTLFKNGF